MGILGRFKEIFRDELERTLPAHVGYLHYLGGVILFLFLIQILTGILLMVYYRPSAQSAYESVKFIMSDVQLGWLVRGIHKWATDLMIIAIILHTLRVYLHGAYKHPRELNWVVGIVLLILTLAFAFSGFLLPWDQASYWGTDAAKEVIERIPVLGKLFLNYLWGGTEITEDAIIRFYFFHVGLLPWLAVAFILLHLSLVNRQGLSELPYERIVKVTNQHHIRFSDFLLDQFMAFLLTLGVLVSLATIFTPTIGERADPLTPLAKVKPQWYFLPFYQLTNYLPSALGVSLIILFILFLLLLPFLDRRPEKYYRQRPVAVSLGAIIMLIIFILAVLGYVLGGTP